MERFGFVKRLADGRQVLPRHSATDPKVTCFCGYVAKTPQGLSSHRRNEHGDAALAVRPAGALIEELLQTPADLHWPTEADAAEIEADFGDDEEGLPEPSPLKATRGADRRRRYSFVEKARALEFNDGAREAGAAPQDGFGNAAPM